MYVDLIQTHPYLYKVFVYFHLQKMVVVDHNIFHADVIYSILKEQTRINLVYP